MEPLSGVASVIAVIQLAGVVTQMCRTYIIKVKEAKEDVIRLTQHISALRAVLEGLGKLLQETEGPVTIPQELSGEVASCFSFLQSIKARVDPDRMRKPMTRWGLRAIRWPLRHSEVDKTVGEIERYKTLFTLALQIGQTAATGALSRQLVLNSLKVAKGAAYNDFENQHDECLPGTRVELLCILDHWTKDINGKCIFWLNGMAGTGKSTISRTVAGRLKEQERLAGSFFFKRGEESRGNAKLLFPTLVKQLRVAIPQLGPHIQRAVDDDPDISERVLREQFEKLVLQPLLVNNQGRPAIMVIVIDALDECDNEDDIRVILRLLPQVQKSRPTHLRFLITSRPELPIRLGLRAVADEYQDLILHKIPQTVVKHDIRLYFEQKFAQLRQERPLPSDFPGCLTISTLVDKAVPLFISAATLYRFISDKRTNPERRLRAILADETSYASNMDSTYKPVLNQLLMGQNERETQQLVEIFKDVVGAIVLLATPLSTKALAQLMEMDVVDIQVHVELLHSVLDIPTDVDEPVRILHLSFRDFLLTDATKGNQFWIDEKMMHHNLTCQCLKIMQHEQHGLRRNICDLHDAGMQRREIDKYTIGTRMPPELQYACRYWAHHLLKSLHPADELIRASTFLKKHLLHWMEAMSLLDIVSEAVGIIHNLQSVMHNGQHPEMVEFMHDAWRFILKNRQLAEGAPLQLYSSGLMFTPENSYIRKTFEGELSAWNRLPAVETAWSAELLTLEGHSRQVGSVAFSPDGKVVASGSEDEAVKLWDTSTGELRQTLTGHSDSVRSVGFSPDGRLASGSYDKTIKLWDCSTGEIYRNFKGHFGRVLSVALSHDCHLLASGSSDNSIKVWDYNTGELCQTFKGHSARVLSVAFSPDGRLLSSGSYDNTVKVWSISKRKLFKTLVGHSGFVGSVVFSPDGSLLASGSNDKTVNIWDPITGELRKTFKGHFRQVASIAFSHDSQFLASGSYDNSIKLWDLSNGIECQTLKGHSRQVRSVVFSPDSCLLASGSHDKAIRIWDLNKPHPRQTLAGHSGWVFSVAFSTTGQLLASSSIDKTIGIWEPSTGELRQIFRGHSNPVRAVAFSPDGKTLASGSDDRTIRLWDTSTSELRQTINGHSVRSLTFSPDGLILASGSSDKTIMLWDPRTGELRQTLKGHSGLVGSLAFSPSGQLLASGSGDNTVKLWEPSSGKLRQTLKGHFRQVISVAFSPDSRLLASSSIEGSTRLWDPSTGELCETHQGHSRLTWTNAGRLSIFENQWVSVQGRRTLWLPPNYRPLCLAYISGVLALGHSSGRVSFISGFS